MASVGDMAERTRTIPAPLLAVAAALALLPWIAYLAVSLPSTYLVTGWAASWVGFDVALLAVLAAVAWAGRRRPDLAAPLSMAAGVLLFADAWFDVTTSAGTDLWVSLLSAVALELPLGVFFVRRALPGMAARPTARPARATLRPALAAAAAGATRAIPAAPHGRASRRAAALSRPAATSGS